MPSNFSWLMPGRIAGMAKPLPDDAVWLREQGFRALLCLTRSDPVPMEGFEVCHVPITDMDSPDFEQIERAVGFLRSCLEAGKPAVVHCHAGQGRTGTILAAFLVAEGWTAEAAILQVRTLRPGSIETLEQEETVRAYEVIVRREA